MPYTASQLGQFYNNLTFGNPPSAATTAVFNNAASANAAGAITDAQAFAAVNYMLAGVRSTVDVAVSTYALFTGATPTQAGVNYLINNPGTGYNTAYYNGVGGSAAAPGPGGFNAENRYYNAAINLAATSGAAGNAAFVATYGSLSLAQTVSTAYNQIIGVSSVGATAAAAAIASISSSLPYFQALAAQRVVSGNSVDLATKAIIVGYILEEGIKADVGAYAKALDGFNFALANGAAVFNTNLLTTYGAGGAGFNSAIQPLLDGQTAGVGSGATLASVGVAANATATVAAGANSTIAFTGDIATNNGQLTVNVANAANSTNDILTLAFSGQTVSTAPSIIAPGVDVLNISANIGAAPQSTVLSIDFQDAQLQTINITGNETVAYSAPLYAFLDGSTSIGALRTINASQSFAAVNIDLSSMGATSNSSAGGGVTVTGSAVADTISVRNFATVTGNGGNDTIVVYQAASVSSVSSLTDDHAGNILGFAGLKATSFKSAAVTATSVQNGLDAAAAAGPGVVSWFTSGGDTYVVADNSSASTFQAGSDFVIRLVGIHNLASSTVTAAGAVVLGG